MIQWFTDKRRQSSYEAALRRQAISRGLPDPGYLDWFWWSAVQIGRDVAAYDVLNHAVSCYRSMYGEADVKHDKGSVDYSKGMTSAHCGICKHYLAGGRCALVKGSIAPNMWCKLFSRR